MATGTLDSEVFWLCDNWPGKPTKFEEVPEDGFTGAGHHNVATAVYPVGTKYQVRNRTAGQPGLSVLTYLQVGTQDATAIAAKSPVVPDSATLWYQVTNDPDSCIALPTGVLAIALSAMTNSYYGWFWTGGVCPEQFVSGLGGTYATVDHAIGGLVAVAGAAVVALGAYATKNVYGGFSLDAI